MELEKLIAEIRNNPEEFWKAFNNLSANFDVEWLYLQAVYSTRVSIPLECGDKYQEIIDKANALITCNDVSVNERRNLIIKALNNQRDIYSFLNIKSYNHYLFVMNFGDITKELSFFVNRLSIDILENMNYKHFREFLTKLEKKGFSCADAVKLAMQIYHVLGYFKGRDLLDGKYGEITKGKLKSIFGSVDLSSVLYDLDKKEPVLNNTVVNLMLGESYHVANTPIKKYLGSNAEEEIVYFFENLNLVLNNWNLILEEYTRRSNLENLELRLNIGQIKAILSNIIDMKRDIKRKESFRGRKKARYEKIPDFEIRDLPLLESDLFDYINVYNKHVTSPRTAPARAVEISRMMEENDSKKFPEVTINEGKYSLFTFHPQDRDIISAGYRTDNCFLPNGAGDGYGVASSLLVYCATTSYGGGIEIRDNLGRTIAFSPILRNGNVLMIHSIEGIKLTAEEKKLVMLFIKAYAEEVIRKSFEKEQDAGIVAVVTAEKYYLDDVLYPDVLNDDMHFTLYDPENKYAEMYSNLNNSNHIIALREGATVRDIKYNYPVACDYVYSLSELGSNHKTVDFSSEELEKIRELNEAKMQVATLAETRKMLLKNHQDVLATAILREIRKLQVNVISKYQELFNISAGKRIDKLVEFNRALEVIKEIYSEIGAELDFDIYDLQRIYYSDNWFIAIDSNGELHYECLAGAEYQFLTVLNDVKKLQPEWKGSR